MTSGRTARVQDGERKSIPETDSGGETIGTG